MINGQHAIVDLDGSFGVWIVGGFFGCPGQVAVDVVDIEGLALGFDGPHGNSGVGEVSFVEVKNNISAQQFNGIDLGQIGRAHV